MKSLSLFVALFACAEPSTHERSALELCGDIPTYPGVVAAFDEDTVTMSRTTYNNIVRWRDDVVDWRECVTAP